MLDVAGAPASCCRNPSAVRHSGRFTMLVLLVAFARSVVSSVVLCRCGLFVLVFDGLSDCSFPASLVCSLWLLLLVVCGCCN